ncbi:c-type cytochrome [Niveispirillum sp. KHB5.9]|uniref:c-type cytochrome n=1 Tax=Niveispirillum sp. KHB5.9 TaxID=3400269 RepID=UPI003A867D74
MDRQDSNGKFDLLLGYALPALVLAQDLLTMFLLRTDKAVPMREELRGWHYLLGTALFLLAGFRLWQWLKGKAPGPQAPLPPRARVWSTTLVQATYLMFFITPLLGVLVVWSHGMSLHLGPLYIPALFGEDRNVWLFTGYFHSGVSTSLLVLKLGALLTAAWFLFRHGRGLFSAFPRGFGAYVLISFTTSVFALSTFKSYAPGPAAVAKFLGVCAVVWGMAWLIRRGRVTSVGEPHALRGVVPAVLSVAILCGIGLYGPYMLFRVSPFATGQVVEAAAHITSHETPLVVEQLPPETDFERKVRAETFKWCTFCHTMNKGGAHLVGPNLFAIMGQKIASVPNFPYGQSLAAHGQAGETWTDENMAKFLNNPDAFAPGTSMTISSGNITDPDVQKALITILKRETGSAAP